MEVKLIIEGTMEVRLSTPNELILELTQTIEKERKRKKLRQKDLCEMADVSISTYQAFIYKKNINIVSLIKIMYTLGMWKNLEGFIAFEEITSIEDIKRAKKSQKLPQRIRKSHDR